MVEILTWKQTRSFLSVGKLKGQQQGGCREAVHVCGVSGVLGQCWGPTGMCQHQQLSLAGVFSSAAAFWEIMKSAYAGSQEGVFLGLVFQMLIGGVMQAEGSESVGTLWPQSMSQSPGTWQRGN